MRESTMLGVTINLVLVCNGPHINDDQEVYNPWGRPGAGAPFQREDGKPLEEKLVSTFLIYDKVNGNSYVLSCKSFLMIRQINLRQDCIYLQENYDREWC
ncbi:hypothetical protein TNCV_3898271 [Trichonephila clavipes]|nr:hypothetical protein TNCV_3898271 [Trichonephila clavipes]